MPNNYSFSEQNALVISNTGNHHLESYVGMKACESLPWESFPLLPTIPHEETAASAFSQPILKHTEQQFSFTSEPAFVEAKSVDRLYLQSLIR